MGDVEPCSSVVAFIGKRYIFERFRCATDPLPGPNPKVRHILIRPVGNDYVDSFGVAVRKECFTDSDLMRGCVIGARAGRRRDDEVACPKTRHNTVEGCGTVHSGHLSRYRYRTRQKEYRQQKHTGLHGPASPYDIDETRADIRCPLP